MSSLRAPILVLDRVQPHGNLSQKRAKPIWLSWSWWYTLTYTVQDKSVQLRTLGHGNVHVKMSRPAKHRD